MDTEHFNNMTNLLKVVNASHEYIIRTVCCKLNQSEKADELIKEILDTSYLHMKQKKDPNRIRKPKNAFMFYCAEHRSEVTSNNPNEKMGGVSKILGAQWKALSDDDKQKYIDMQNEDVRRYEEATM